MREVRILLATEVRRVPWRGPVRGVSRLARHSIYCARRWVCTMNVVVGLFCYPVYRTACNSTTRIAIVTSMSWSLPFRASGFLLLTIHT